MYFNRSPSVRLFGFFLSFISPNVHCIASLCSQSDPVYAILYYNIIGGGGGGSGGGGDVDCELQLLPAAVVEGVCGAGCGETDECLRLLADEDWCNNNGGGLDEDDEDVCCDGGGGNSDCDDDGGCGANEVWKNENGKTIYYYIFWRIVVSVTLYFIDKSVKIT